MTADQAGTSPFGFRFIAFLGAAAVCLTMASVNALPNIETVLQGGDAAPRAAVIALVQYSFAFIVAISSVASAHEKGGHVAVLVFMTVNAYFAFDAASHRHDGAHIAGANKATITKELAPKEARRNAIGNDFEHVSEKQLQEAEHKRDVAEKRCLKCANTKEAQKEVDRLAPLQAKTKEAADLDTDIKRLNAELKALKATGDSDNDLANVAGGDAKTTGTVITLLIALGIELANKYGPYWTFRFLIGGLGYPQSSVYERRKAEKAAEKARKAREAEEAEARRREAEADKAAAEAAEKKKLERAAKRAEDKTREKGDPETVAEWINSPRTVAAPGHQVQTSDAYRDYEADTRARGKVPVGKGRWFTDELRKLGFDISEIDKSRRCFVYGLALAPYADRAGLRIVSSR